MLLPHADSKCCESLEHLLDHLRVVAKLFPLHSIFTKFFPNFEKVSLLKNYVFNWCPATKSVEIVADTKR